MRFVSMVGVHAPRGRMMFVVLCIGLVMAACSSQPEGDDRTTQTVSTSPTTSAPSVDQDAPRSLSVDEARSELREVFADLTLPPEHVDCVLGSESLLDAVQEASDRGEFDREVPTEQFAGAWVNASLDCGLLEIAADEAGSAMAAVLNVSEEAAVCVAAQIYSSAEAKQAFIEVMISAVTEQPVLPLDPAVTSRMTDDYLDAMHSCGLVVEIARTVESDMAVSEATASCFVTELYASEVMRQVAELAVIEAMATGGEVDSLLASRDSLVSDQESEITAATMAALTACATDDELTALGIAGLSYLPGEIDGYSLWASELMSELSNLSEGYGDRNWVFGAYGDDELRYRVVISTESLVSDDGLPILVTYEDPTVLRDWIPAEGLFAIEGGFDMDFDAVAYQGLDNVRLVCAPGFVGDSFEVDTARSFYEDDADLEGAFELGFVRFMCFFDGAPRIGFIVSDTTQAMEDFMAVAGQVAAAANRRISVDHLKVGDCFDDSSEDEGMYADLFDCNQPHEMEVYALVELSGVRDTSAGENALYAELHKECFHRFETYVGHDHATSVYDYFELLPSEEAWENGDREGICIVYRDDSSGFIKTTSSAANAGV